MPKDSMLWKGLLCFVIGQPKHSFSLKECVKRTYAKINRIADPEGQLTADTNNEVAYINEVAECEKQHG